MKQKTKAEGISLITLVITIIIIIILAGAIILSLNNSGIIDKAKLAKESNDFTSIRQMIEMERSNAMFEGNTFDKSKITIPDTYSNEVEIIDKDTVIIKGVTNSNITNIPNAVEKLGAVYIPFGFDYLEGTKETGLVIKDVSAGITNNEYVWVPVEGTLKTEAFMTDEWFTNNWGDSFGNLFADDIASAGYTPMKTSVEKYNGFYVSRYEAGIAGNVAATSSSPVQDGTVKPLSQKDKIVWNNIAWDANFDWSSYGNEENPGAAKVAKSAYPENSPVASSLLYGAQYDAMLNYINSASTSVTNSTNWGNHRDSTFTFTGKYQVNGSGAYTTVTGATKPANTNWLLTTGASEQNKAKNIYDVAGNVWEWTYELSPADAVRVMRSGSFYLSGADFPAAYRGGDNPGDSYVYCGFRFALYIK